MFNKPLTQITFQDVEAFCREWPEGVRVEYKGQLIATIPKTISAFANTLGGLLVLGVTTDKGTNKVRFPIEGLDNQPGIEERIIQSSVQGIYPSVLPSVRILEVPGSNNKIVVIVKVQESIEAPHAIQNSTRVYIRTGSLSEPYDLAEIDRIDYLLKRRERPEKNKLDAILQSEQRIQNHLSEREKHRPSISVIISRLYPREPLIPLDGVQEFVFNKLPSLGNSGIFMQEVKRIPTGMFSSMAQGDIYGELNHYGLVFTRQMFELKDSQYDSEKKKFFINVGQIVWIIGRSLRLAQNFLKWAMYSGNIEITVKFSRVFNKRLRYTSDDRENWEFVCSETDFSLSENTTTEELVDRFPDLIANYLKRILWAFNCEPKNVDERVLEVLRVNNLI